MIQSDFDLREIEWAGYHVSGGSESIGDGQDGPLRVKRAGTVVAARSRAGEEAAGGLAVHVDAYW